MQSQNNLEVQHNKKTPNSTTAASAPQQIKFTQIKFINGQQENVQKIQKP